MNLLDEPTAKRKKGGRSLPLHLTKWHRSKVDLLQQGMERVALV